MSPQQRPLSAVEDDTVLHTMESDTLAQPPTGEQLASNSEHSSSSSAAADPSEHLPCEYDPNRVITPAQLEVLQILVHPIWIWDFIDRKMVRFVL